MASASGESPSSKSRAEIKPSACADGRPPSLSSPVRASARTPAGQPDAALSLSLQKAKAIRPWIQVYRDHIVTAHCHIAMVLPAQSLDRCDVAAAVRINPFGGVDFPKIAGSHPLSGREFSLDQRCPPMTYRVGRELATPVLQMHSDPEQLPPLLQSRPPICRVLRSEDKGRDCPRLHLQICTNH